MKTAYLNPYQITWIELIPSAGIVTKHDRKQFGYKFPSGRLYRKYLQFQTKLKGEELIVYSYLKHKSNHYKGLITTYDKIQAEECGLTKKYYQKILCSFYELGLAERLPNGRLKIN